MLMDEPQMEEDLFGSMRSQIEKLLSEANGNRKVRIVEIEQLSIYFAAFMRFVDYNPDIFHNLYYGEPSAWNHYNPVCTYYMFFYDSDTKKIHIGITSCPAYRVSPGRAWSIFAPWDITNPDACLNKAKLWTELSPESGVLCLGKYEPKKS